MTRYKMMLTLMKHHPNTFIVPTYDIDAIWHTHLAFPCQYLSDCRRIAGRAIHHDDDAGQDRSPASFLSSSAAKTERLWQATFGSAWRKEGAMHRGEPPQWYWSDRARAAAMPAGKPCLLQVLPGGESPRDSQAAGLFKTYVISVVGRAFGTAGEEVRPRKRVTGAGHRR